MVHYTKADQACDWQILHDEITRVLDRFGNKDAFGRGDYWLVDDNYGTRRHRLEFQNLDLFQVDILRQLQAVLVEYPDWCIMVQEDAPGEKTIKPGMGVIICQNEIIDELQREFLPERFRDTIFGAVSTETAETVAARVRKLMNKPRQ